MLLIISLALLVLGLWLAKREFSFKKNAIRIQGVIIGYKGKIDTKGSRLFYPIYEYVDPSTNMKNQYESSTGASFKVGEVGNTVNLLYNAESSTALQAETFSEMWLAPTFITCIGLLLFLIYLSNLFNWL
jgi:hypothetical protein